MPELLAVTALDRTGDESRYRRIVVVSSGLIMVLFGIGAALQISMFSFSGLPAAPTVPVWVRMAVNLSTAAVVMLAFISVPVRRYSAGWRVATVLVACGLAALLRMVLQVLVGVYPQQHSAMHLVDFFAAMAISLVAVMVGILLADYEYRLRIQERSASVQALRATRSLEALQSEELRVRREVAEALHGTVQQGLVLIGVRLQTLEKRLEAKELLDESEHAEFRRLRQELDRMREQDVREMSQLLYPNGVDLGLAQATRMLMRRVPSAIATRVHIGRSVAHLDDPARPAFEVALRLLVIRVLEEGITNALRHGTASTLQLDLEVSQGEGGSLLSMTLDDDGKGVSGPMQPAHGSARLAQRIRDYGGFVELGPSPLLPGARLTLRLPVANPAELGTEPVAQSG